eukprot:jgi/Phyca11/124193/e_gw1.53.336.1
MEVTYSDDFLRSDSGSDDEDTTPTQLAAAKESPDEVEPEADNANLEQDREHLRDGLTTDVSTPTNERQVDVINIPKPKGRGEPRSTSNRFEQTKIASSVQRLAVHKYPSNLTVSLDNLVVWARNTANLNAYVGALTTFYAVKSKTRFWFDDRKWLEQDWRKAESDVGLFEQETGTLGIFGDALRHRHHKLANEVISNFTSCPLSSEFATSTGNGFITFADIVGGLCRAWLNDSPVGFCLESIAGGVGHCLVQSTLTWSVGWPSTPKAPITDKQFIIHSMNLNGNHWG